MNIVKHIGFLPGCKLFCALLFLISFRPLQLSGQPTRLDFNGNLKDVSGQFDGVSNSNLSYVTESDKTAVSLSGPEHVRFPIALSKSLKSERLRFRIRFKVLPDSQGNIEEGRIFLFGNARHQRRFPGFRLDLHSDGENLFLVNTAGDVLAFHHEGEDRQGKLGKVLPNKWYEIVATLEMGREAPYIEYIFDGWQQFHELLVGEGFDLSSFRTHLSAGSPLQIGGVGYYPLGASVEAEEATDTGATLLVDNFVVEPTIVSVDSKRIKETFINLSSHLNGSAPLTVDQLEALKHSLYLELDLTTAKEAFSEIKSFLQVYESMSFSLFHNGTRVQLDDLDMMAQIVFHVKQWMLDSLYVGGDLQLLEGVAFEEASVWPGVPKANAPRTTSTNPASLTISGTYNSTPGIQSNGSAHAYRMTGCYAAPGEIVTLTFPDKALNQDLRVMVGVHFWNTYYVRPYNRLNRISLSYPVTNSTVQVVNPMGGSILIRVPDGSNIGDLTVTVENSVYTPYFSTKAGAETTSQEWAKAKFESNVPWVEFESDKVQLSAPRSLFDAGTLNPQQILAEWDSILDAFSIVGGRSLDRARPYFFLADRQPVANGTAAPAANPLPLIPGNNTGSWENFLDPRPNSNSNGVSAEYIVLHEMGHAHNYPTLGNQEQESNVNLPAVAAYNLTYGFDLTTDAMAQSIDQGLSLDEAAIDWMISPNFSAKAALSHFGQDNGNGARLLGMSMDYEEWDRAWNEEQTEMGYVWNEIRYQSRGHAKFVELANLYGWESVGNAHAAFMQLGAKDNRVINYGVADDDFIRKASYANNKNLAPLFHFWGITPSAELVQELNYLPKATEFKARLKHYRSIIPGNNTAFRAHFTTLQTGAWTKGYWSDQANGFQVFRYKGLEKVYDETRAKLMSDQIDYLISVYFSEEGSVNQPPVIVSGPASQIFDINTPVSIPMTVTDSDTEQKHLRYSFKFSNPSREYFPEGLFLNSHTGELYGQMDNPSIWGPFKIGVFDGLTEVFSDPFDIGFTDPSGEPILMFTNIIDLEVASGETLTHSFNIEGSTEGFYDFKIRSLFEPHVDFSPSWIQKDSFGITLSPSDINIGEYSDLFVIINTAHIIDKAGLFSIRVVPGDDSLHLVGTPVNKLMATRPYDFTPSLLRGSQVQGPVNFSASNLPGWLRLDTSTGRIFGTPQANDGGTYSGITITASSSSKSATLGPFSIEVSYDGKLKVLNLKSAYTLSSGQKFVIPIVLEDLDAEDSIYMPDAYTNLRFADSKPEWMHYDGGSRPAKLYGTVPEGAGGSYSLEFNIHGGKPFYSLPVTVLGATESAPTITGFAQTSDVTLTLTGEAEAGSSVVIYNGNTSLGTVIADLEGRFSSTFNSALSAGSYSITAKTTDSAGNISQSSGSFNLVVITDMKTEIPTYEIISAVLFSAPLTYLFQNNTITVTDCETSASGALVIPSTYNGYPVTSIGAYAFQNCESLTSVTIPDSVTTIGRGAFRDCSSLTSILIPSSVTLIGHDNHAPAFRGCDSLTDIEVDTSNAQYNSEDGVLFSKDGTTLIKFPGGKSGHYTIPDSVTSIEQAAFAYASKMTSVTIPNSVTSIGQYAFWAAKGLTSVTIPESITSLEPRVFYDSNIESIVIPESVTSIGFGAFSHCGSLTSVTIPNEDTVIDASAFEASVTIFLGKAATIDSQETVTSTAVGETLVLAMVTSGKNVTYQWSKDGTDIAGATSATLELSGVTGSDAGSYVLKVTNGGGSVESSPIVVSVQTSDPGEGDGTGKGEQENAVPVLAGMSDVELESGGSKSVSVSFSDSDQGDNHTVTVSSDNSKVSVRGSGNTSGSEYTLSAADGYEGTLTVTVVVSDGTDSDTGTFQVSVSGTSGGETVADESFGEPVTYTNVATTAIGQVTINGTAAREGDVVAFYVGDELRGKQAVVVYAGTAWVNAQVHAAGGDGDGDSQGVRG